MADFREALGQRESGGDYGVVNSLGYTGKYQFGQPRLNDFNRVAGTAYTTADLRGNPALQERVADWHFADIDRAIDAGGFVDKGMSRNGLRAVAHLGGVGGMKRFAATGGGYNPSDAYGTSLSDYYNQFSGSLEGLGGGGGGGGTTRPWNPVPVGGGGGAAGLDPGMFPDIQMALSDDSGFMAGLLAASADNTPTEDETDEQTQRKVEDALLVTNEINLQADARRQWALNLLKQGGLPRIGETEV